MRKLLTGAAICAVTLSATLSALTAAALPIAPAPVKPVPGVPTPCPSLHPWPGDDVSVPEVARQITKTFGFKLAGDQWGAASRDSIKVMWQTLDAVSCTSYLADLQGKVNGDVGLNAASIGGFAWGDWGLTRDGYVTLDFAKFQRALDSGDEGRLVRLVIHELGHVLNSDRYEEPAYWREFKKLHAAQGVFSSYAAGSVTETFSDVLGYYVGRCALDNPYDTGKYDAYYEFAKENVFGGKEFGPEPGVKPDCKAPDADAEPPQPGATPSAGSWVEALGGE